MFDIEQDPLIRYRRWFRYDTYIELLFSTATVSLPDLSTSAFSPSMIKANEIYLAEEFTCMIDRVKSLYTIESDLEFKRYLIGSDRILVFLINCNEQIQKYFKAESITIRIVKDYTLPDWETINIAICDTRPFTEALDALDFFIQDWFYYQAIPVRKKVTFSIE